MQTTAQLIARAEAGLAKHPGGYSSKTLAAVIAAGFAAVPEGTIVMERGNLRVELRSGRLDTIDTATGEVMVGKAIDNDATREAVLIAHARHAARLGVSMGR